MAPGPNLVATSDTPPRGDLAGRRRGRPGETPGGLFLAVPAGAPLTREHHKPVPLPPEVVAAVGDRTVGTTPSAEMLERLDAALRLLPAAERNAALLAYSGDGGAGEVAAALGIPVEDAEALTRNAVQLLRGALADLDPEAAPDFAMIASRMRTRRRPGEGGAHG